MTDTANDPEKIRDQKARKGRWTSLIWFVIAFFIFKSLVIDEYARQEMIATWPEHEAVITEIGEITWAGSDQDEYQAAYFFEVEHKGQTRRYRDTLYHPKPNGLEKYFETTHAVGNRLTVRINPNDPQKYAFEGDKNRIRWLGIILSSGVALLGVMTLFSKRSIEKEVPQAPEST